MKIIYFDELGSTNDKAAELAAEGAEQGTVVVARRQFSGRGRQGRSWESEEGGLYMSAVLRPEKNTPQITLLTAVAVARAAERELGVSPKIKWPNDLVLNGKKLSGILTEAKAGGAVIVGIGININNCGFSRELNSSATSVYIATGREYDLTRIAEAVALEVLECTALDFNTVADEYRSCMYSVERGIIYENERLTAVGITDDGQLIAEKSDGVRITIQSGEVNVRGLYGF